MIILQKDLSALKGLFVGSTAKEDPGAVNSGLSEGGFFRPCPDVVPRFSRPSSDSYKGRDNLGRRSGDRWNHLEGRPGTFPGRRRSKAGHHSVSPPGGPDGEGRVCRKQPEGRKGGFGGAASQPRGHLTERGMSCNVQVTPPVPIFPLGMAFYKQVAAPWQGARPGSEALRADGRSLYTCRSNGALFPSLLTLL